MPESRRRKKSSPQGDDAPVTATGAAKARRPAGPNPTWWVPVMVGLMLLGLVWIVVWYVSENQLPVPGIGSWNLVAGFGIILAGFLMTTRWR
ncbi:cell division protein CrgA [Pseudokineococcus sp. 1T1Z-3]|uniref:cell division protein CrgA n=1 Tax=Pseudokineococcus sp. 1T1Z-3 TaxID=3132745 RepID=UPI0030AC1D77